MPKWHQKGPKMSPNELPNELPKWLRKGAQKWDPFWTSKKHQKHLFFIDFYSICEKSWAKDGKRSGDRRGALVLFYVWSVSDVLLLLYYLILSFVLWHAFFLSLFLSLITSVVLSLVLSLIIFLRLTCEHCLSVLYFPCYLFLFGLRCFFLYCFPFVFVRPFFIYFCC